MQAQQAQAELARLLSALDRKKATHKLSHYQPYGFQMAFHNAVGYMTSIPASQRALMAGNKVGKTLCGGMEGAMHLTGLYPDWFRGRRFYHAINMLVGGYTNESVRDLCQAELFGDPTDDRKLGTGSIPIEKIGKVTRKAGVPNALDIVQVKHVSGAWSKCMMRAYEQGAKKHMGSRIHVGWLDEEPPEDIWAQYIRGTFSTKGILYITFTPEEGVTKVVHGFINELQKGQALIRATWDDAPHMNHEFREQMLAATPAYQREMRSKGIPLMGSGLVFQVPEEQISYEGVKLNEWWPRICAIDFGIDHAFAAVWIAWDRDTDTLYVYDCYKVSGEKMPVHVSKIKTNGEYIPVIWPHDGLQRQKDSGEPLAELYRKEGANMYHEQFSNPPAPGVEEGKGGNSVEYGIEEILHRMQTNRFKIDKGLKLLWDELRMYHRVDGKIVALNDDAMSAMRYAALSIRHAQTPLFKVKAKPVALGASNW
jgi:phage terminase large subunit-like protein